MLGLKLSLTLKARAQLKLKTFELARPLQWSWTRRLWLWLRPRVFDRQHGSDFNAFYWLARGQTFLEFLTRWLSWVTVSRKEQDFNYHYKQKASSINLYGRWAVAEGSKVLHYEAKPKQTPSLHWKPLINSFNERNTQYASLIKPLCFPVIEILSSVKNRTYLCTNVSLLLVKLPSRSLHKLLRENKPEPNDSRFAPGLVNLIKSHSGWVVPSWCKGSYPC